MVERINPLAHTASVSPTVQPVLERINPLAQGKPAGEVAAVEVAFEKSALGQLSLVEVSCGRFGRDVRAMADLNQRIVIPKPSHG